MQNEHHIIRRVYGAKEDGGKADALIRDFLPFIRAEASKTMSRSCTDQDDEYSIAMIAFHEAVLGFERRRGSFIGYAATCIRSRIIDFQRREARHRGHLSIHETYGEDDHELLEELADERDHYDEVATREATRQEIAELTVTLSSFGVSFADVSDNCPRQERTLHACAAAIRCGVQNPKILEDLLRTKKLPMGALVRLSGADRKTLERHRKYILAMLLIQTNGYEIIRGHLRHVLNRKEGSQ